MALIKPSEMDFSEKNIIMLISGLPGTGKTTLALSAPDVVLVDTDEGIVRVSPEHRRDTIIAKSYEELLNDLRGLSGYKSLVIDTGGALIDMLKDWAVRNEPSASKKSGGFSQQGYGIVKAEFLRLSAELRRRFNVIYLFHVNKDKNAEEIFYDIVCEGSAKTLVYQPADLCGFLHMVNGERYLGFTPTMNYNAKSAYGIKGLVKVPELMPGMPNNFLTLLFEKIRANLRSESQQNKEDAQKYDNVMEAGGKIIMSVKAPEDVEGALEEIKALKHALTSEAELKAALKGRLNELHIVYDKAEKKYVAQGG